MRVTGVDLQAQSPTYRLKIVPTGPQLWLLWMQAPLARTLHPVELIHELCIINSSAVCSNAENCSVTLLFQFHRLCSLSGVGGDRDGRRSSSSCRGRSPSLQCMSLARRRPTRRPHLADTRPRWKHGSAQALVQRPTEE